MGTITEAPDPAVEAIVASWPCHWDAEQARRLGLPADRSVDEVVAHYLEDFGPGRG